MLLVVVAGVCVLALVCTRLLARVSALAAIPNAHFSVPFSTAWIWWKRQQGCQNRTILALHQRLGPIVRLGPREVSVNSAGGLRTVYVSGAFEKTSWYRELFQNYNVSNLVSTEAHGPHSVQKRMITGIYSKSYLQNSRDLAEISRATIFGRLLPLLDSLATSQTAVNVLSLGKAIGMDFTTAYLFGSANGTDFVSDKPCRNAWLAMYEKFKYQQPEDRAFGPVEQWCLGLCKAAEAYGVVQPGIGTFPVVHRQLFSSLQRLHSPARPSAEPSIIVASEMLDHIVAGHETTGITLTYLMYELSRRPELMVTLRHELHGLSRPIQLPGVACDAHTRVLPSAQEIDKLPLLEAVVRETLRLYPAAGAPQPRVSHSKSAVIEGYVIPSGVTVSSCAYSLHRNPRVFPEPEEWIPSRWMRTPAEVKEMNRWFWAFGSGGRMCLGSNLALQELKLVAAAIYSNFTTFIVDAEGIEQADSFIGGPVSNKLILGFTHAR
ncbi:hypothetical protein LOZ36_006538 [Ophidiomyces ophidiicola]|nr:hypothetical protein LOZ36_006538 [Ophidiomyces ophidiicola]